MATEDYTAFLGHRDRSKLARVIGVPIGDGRVFRRGAVVSAEDAQRSDMDRQRNSLLTQQTSGYRQSQEMLQREQQRVGAAPSPQFLPPAGQSQVAQPQGVGSAPQGAPSPLMLAQANQIQRYQQVNPPQVPVQQPNTGISVAAGPNISTAPTGLPQGSVGFQRADGSYSVQAPMGPGVGTQTFANEGAARGAFAAAPSPQFLPQPSVQPNAPTALPPQPKPQPTLADRTYTPEQISRMTPEQLMTREAFDQQNVARKQQEAQTKAQAGYATQEDALAAGNKAKQPGQAIQVEPTGKGGFTFKVVQEQKPQQTNISVDKGANKAEEVIGEAAGQAYLSLEAQAEEAERAAVMAKNVEELYNSGAYSGPGADAVGFLKRGAAILGFNVPEAATQDQLQQIYAENQLLRTKELFKGMGALSNLEGNRAEGTVVNLSRTPEGNLQILKWQSANAPMLRQSVELRDKLRDEGKPVEQINREVKKFIRDNYKTLDSFKQGKSEPKGQQAPAGPTGQAQPEQPIKIGRFTVIQQ